MKKKILYGIMAVVILIGIIMFFVHGFNIGNVYGDYTKLGFYNENGVKQEELSELVKECFPDKEAVYQDVEYFGEMVLITLPTVSDDEINNFVSKINEKYSLEYTKDDLDVITMPSANFNEIIKPYILPVALSIAISLVYIGIRYHSLGIIKQVGKTILAILVVEALILCIYLIFNLPIDLSIVPTTLIGLGIALLYTTSTNNELLEQKKAKEEEEENK